MNNEKIDLYTHWHRRWIQNELLGFLENSPIFELYIRFDWHSLPINSLFLSPIKRAIKLRSIRTHVDCDMDCLTSLTKLSYDEP